MKVQINPWKHIVLATFVPLIVMTLVLLPANGALAGYDDGFKDFDTRCFWASTKKKSHIQTELTILQQRQITELYDDSGNKMGILEDLLKNKPLLNKLLGYPKSFEDFVKRLDETNMKKAWEITAIASTKSTLPLHTTMWRLSPSPHRTAHSAAISGTQWVEFIDSGNTDVDKDERFKYVMYGAKDSHIKLTIPVAGWLKLEARAYDCAGSMASDYKVFLNKDQNAQPKCKRCRKNGDEGNDGPVDTPRPGDRPRPNDKPRPDRPDFGDETGGDTGDDGSDDGSDDDMGGRDNDGPGDDERRGPRGDDERPDHGRDKDRGRDNRRR